MVAHKPKGSPGLPAIVVETVPRKWNCPQCGKLFKIAAGKPDPTACPECLAPMLLETAPRSATPAEQPTPSAKKRRRRGPLRADAWLVKFYFYSCLFVLAVAAVVSAGMAAFLALSFQPWALIPAGILGFCLVAAAPMVMALRVLEIHSTVHRIWDRLQEEDED